MKNRIYSSLPFFLQNILVSIFNLFAYRIRYGGKYRKYLKKYYNNRSLSRSELLIVQEKKFNEFVRYAKENSGFYKDLYLNIDDCNFFKKIKSLPVIDKELLRKNISSVYTLPSSKGVVSKTGGTTGKSLEVIYTKDDIQERFALLDDFRIRFGYKLGERTAWFSGKNLLSNKDIKRKRFWRTDILHNIRYYSTFHIKREYLSHYISNIIEFKPRFLVGFPSTIVEIAKYGLESKQPFPKDIVKAVFPTAETISEESRRIIEAYFHSKVYDQYASSEGAPFIFECHLGKLHLELQSGVFEVLDDKNIDALSGRLVVTSFTSHGTPLIRYDIGDNIELDDPSKMCSCGNSNPIVKRILGRIDDYIYSHEIGKINLGNISNTLKNVKGVVQFQIVQNDLSSIIVNVVNDSTLFNEDERLKFMENIRERVGQKMIVNFNLINEIPMEKSGKFRLVKNNIKHLL